MSKPVNYYGIGLFIITAVVIIVVLVVTLSSVNWLHRSFYAETYFNESIQGLTVGSPIKLRGVEVGKVDEISFVDKIYPAKEFLHDIAGLVYVKMELDPDKLPINTDLTAALETAVKNGLRVQPTSQGITGGMYLELSFFAKNGSSIPHYSWEPKYVFIPSIPSQFTQVTQMIGDIANAFKDAHLDELGRSLDVMADSANEAIHQAQIGKVSAELQKTIEGFDILAWRINQALSNNQQMIGNLTQNLNQVSDTLKVMMARNPSQLLFTTPPPNQMEPAR